MGAGLVGRGRRDAGRAGRRYTYISCCVCCDVGKTEIVWWSKRTGGGELRRGLEVVVGAVEEDVVDDEDEDESRWV